MVILACMHVFQINTQEMYKMYNLKLTIFDGKLRGGGGGGEVNFNSSDIQCIV